MARTKIKCNGFSKNGQPCNNWATQGSMYCTQHKYQETDEDIRNRKTSNSYANLVLLFIIVLGFILSLLFGCEENFLKWMSH